MPADQADIEVCESGLWVDQATGAVVDAPPATGVQLVPPGGLLRPDRVRAIAEARSAAPAAATAEAPEPAAKKAPAKKAAPKAEA